METSKVMSSRSSNIPLPGSGSKLKRPSLSAIPGSPERQIQPGAELRSPLRSRATCKSECLENTSVHHIVSEKGLESAAHLSQDGLIAALRTPPHLTQKDENNCAQSHGELIESLFWRDKSFMDMCNDGLHRKLIRTKDGGNTKEQLAQLVKLLRQCVTGYTERLKSLRDILSPSGDALTRLVPAPTNWRFGQRPLLLVVFVARFDLCY
jgi:hypothetical protein